MKKYKSLLLGLSAAIGVVLLLQSWTYIPKGNRITNTNLVDHFQSQESSVLNDQSLINENFEDTISDLAIKGEHPNTMTKSTSSDSTLIETTNIDIPDTVNCDSLETNFFKVDDFIIMGKSINTNIITSQQQQALESSKYSTKMSNDYLRIWHCENGTGNVIVLKTLTSKIYAEKLEDDSTIIYLKLDSLKVDTSSITLPTVITYHKTEVDINTLCVVVFYKDDVKYKYNDLSFKVNTSRSTIVVYFVKDDPVTSRGTVTNVQTRGEPLPPNENIETESY